MIPQHKRPINYKCLSVEALNLFLDNHKHKNVFMDWLGEKQNTIFPKKMLWEHSHDRRQKMWEKIGMIGDDFKHPHGEYDSIFLLPLSYDSSNDEINWEMKRQKFLNSMRKMAEMRGDVFDEKLTDENVKYGRKSFEKVNIVLKDIHEKFSQYYVDDILYVWQNYSEDVDEYGYPVLQFTDKALFFSELVEYIKSFGIDTSGFRIWLLESDFIEGRDWDVCTEYSFNDKTYDNKEAEENIKIINKLLKSVYKTDEINIFIDNYDPTIYPEL